MEDSKGKQVLEFYLLSNKLNSIIRSYPLNKNISYQYRESIIENIQNLLSLAVIMKIEYDYNISLVKVVLMVYILKLEKLIARENGMLGTVIFSQKKIVNSLIEDSLQDIIDKYEVSRIIEELSSNYTAEAKFVNNCNKLESDILMKLEDETIIGKRISYDNSNATGSPFFSYLKMSRDLSKKCIESVYSIPSNDKNFLEVKECLKIENNLNDKILLKI